ncbi:MAG: ribonuclease HII [Actinobacteria bacterium]|nr:ribonuclease HII [Actinomycetota bacterium]
MVSDASGLLEKRLYDAGFVHVAGVDEVGRGALAGPLVAAAVILPPGTEIDGLRDSKMCTRLQRERLAREIEERAEALAVVRVYPNKIDRIGLQRCNLMAMRKALSGLDVGPDYVLVDGFPLKRLKVPSLAVKKADAVSRSVAAASIVAKVHRDAAMRRYHRRYPQYGFLSNVGYGTRYHWRALKEHGPCDIHRRSFYGVTGFPEDDAGAPDEPLLSGDEVALVGRFRGEETTDRGLAARHYGESRAGSVTEEDVDLPEDLKEIG